MIYAFVLAEDGTWLMPTDIRHARRLLKKKEAVIAGHKPFTIQLTRPSERHVQPVECCFDTGPVHIGVSIKSEKHEFVHNQYDNLKDKKKRHANRLKMRRARRGRKRYRKARFDNRKKDRGWIAPSLENKEQPPSYCGKVQQGMPDYTGNHRSRIFRHSGDEGIRRNRQRSGRQKLSARLEIRLRDTKRSRVLPWRL